MKDEKLLERFGRLYKGCKLYCVHLDGFSHSVFYKDEKGHKHIDGYTAYAPEQYDAETLYDDGVYRAWNEDKTKAFFLGYLHYCYQNNAQELIYEDVKNW